MDRLILDSYMIRCNDAGLKPNFKNLEKYKLDNKLIEEVKGSKINYNKRRA